MDEKEKNMIEEILMNYQKDVEMKPERKAQIIAFTQGIIHGIDTIIEKYNIDVSREFIKKYSEIVGALMRENEINGFLE